ncbi:energy transducer TonB [Haliscomenobacter hydrossis]|uniref:TonB family protein n=1 Tax=Haliscomenobacter hydrossis (strain ATCC 27775 / DSM 1100 / LMG 10767 / O) TaxID=760192 RepID=F4KQ09_HALH1|nr:energy transducer TonB [Haliscomenobacter hydrossis]AEE53213.1 TonB family protein [Haliscomenobacter hydrossis DSM 1100]
MKPLSNLNFYKFSRLILFLIGFSVTMLHGQNRSESLPPMEMYQVTENGDTIYKIVETMPGFPNGQAGLFKFLAKNIQYPLAAREYGVEGMVVIRLIIDATGKVIEPTIVKSSSEKKDDTAQGFVIDSRKPYYDQIDKEALRVVKMMPDWTPGIVEGEAVSIAFNLPISFRLEGRGRRNNRH